MFLLYNQIGYVTLFLHARINTIILSHRIKYLILIPAHLLCIYDTIPRAKNKCLPQFHACISQYAVEALDKWKGLAYVGQNK